MTEKRQTSQGYIIRILQHFAAFCDALSSCDENFVQAYLDQNFTHKGKGLLGQAMSSTIEFKYTFDFNYISIRMEFI